MIRVSPALATDAYHVLASADPADLSPAEVVVLTIVSMVDVVTRGDYKTARNIIRQFTR